MAKYHFAPPDDEDKNQSAPTLSGSSPIQVRFIGWLVVTCAAGFGCWIWWAAGISTKLDVVISNQAVQVQNTKEIIANVATIKEWRVKIDGLEVGKRLDRMEADTRDLSKAFELHKAMSSTGTTKP